LSKQSEEKKMSKKVFTYVLIAVLLGVILSACERPASVAPTSGPAEATIPFPVTQPASSLGALATQTAAAKNPQITPTGAQPGGTNATAKPQATAAQAQPTAAPAQPTAVPPTATAMPAVVIPTATPGRPSSYTIQQGDHYICVARRYNVSLSDFFSLNGLSMSSQAVAGTTVKIPQSGSWNSANGSRTLKPHPDTYTVKSGDTVNRIACDYGDVDPNNIILANNLQSPYTISAGQSLQIP
jgi:LysM repeat protein